MTADEKFPQHAPAGWYPDAQGVQRWWDGTRWAAPQADAVVASPESHSRPPWWRRAVVPTVVGVGAFLLGVAVGGSADDSPPESEAATVESEQDSSAADADEVAADDAEAPPADAEPEVAAAGTRENPLRAGSTVELGSWSVTLGLSNADATEAVMSENEFNESPAEGRKFVLVPVTAVYSGDEPGLAWMELTIEFVGSAGNTFGSAFEDNCGVIPDPLIDQGEVFAGGEVGGNVCVAVPTDQIAEGAWSVSESFSFDDTRFFVGIS